MNKLLVGFMFARQISAELTDTVPALIRALVFGRTNDHVTVERGVFCPGIVHWSVETAFSSTRLWELAEDWVKRLPTRRATLRRWKSANRGPASGQLSFERCS